jgi:hypothetical protein
MHRVAATLLIGSGKFGQYQHDGTFMGDWRDRDIDLSTGFQLAIVVNFCDLEGTINKCTAPTISAFIS